MTLNIHPSQIGHLRTGRPMRLKTDLLQDRLERLRANLIDYKNDKYHLIVDTTAHVVDN